jgi:hypothetical protein
MQVIGGSLTSKYLRTVEVSGSAFRCGPFDKVDGPQVGPAFTLHTHIFCAAARVAVYPNLAAAFAYVFADRRSHDSSSASIPAW